MNMKRLIWAGLAVLMAAGAGAAQQTINIGTTPNDHTGDPIRSAFNKDNLNVAELYAKFPVALADGGTGGTSAATARTALGLAIGINVSAWNAALDAIAALTPSNDDVLQRKAGSWVNRTIAQYKADLALVKADVGLGSVENTALSTWAGSTNLTTLGTITTGIWTGTAVAVANGGTGSTSASAARTALGLVIGTNVEAWDADLDTLAGKVIPSGTLIGDTSVPTWTAIHTWSLAEPRLILSESDGGTDGKIFDLDLNGHVLLGRTRTDADGAGKNWLSVTSTPATTTIANVSLGNATDNPTFTWLGTGAASFGGLGAFTGVLSSGNFTANGTALSSGASPGYFLTESDQGSNLKVWAVAPTSGVLNYQTQTDVFGSPKNYLSIARGATTTIATQTYGNATDRPTHIFHGNVILANAGDGIQVKEGSNAALGTCTLVAGTCTVSTTKVTANSRIFLTAQSLGTVTVGQGLAINARTAGTSFTVVSTAPTDTSVVAWDIVEPAP